jgi:hypothetical protein
VSKSLRRRGSGRGPSAGGRPGAETIGDRFVAGILRREVGVV